MIWLVVGALLIAVGSLIAFNAGGSADAVLRYERRSGAGPPGWVTDFAGRWAGWCLLGMGIILVVAAISKLA